MPDQLPSFPLPSIGGNSSTVGTNDITPTLGYDTYNITNTNWYKSLPYGFAFWDIKTKAGDKPSTIMWLPISPNNLTVTTNFATNIITTLYGIVEEHSEVRYYDISIQGTTGFAPRYVDPFTSSNLLPDNISDGRDSFPLAGISLGGFLPEITNTIAAATNLLSTIQGGSSNQTGVDPDKSGYVAFHNLYRCFLQYKKDAAQIAASKSAASTSLASLVPNEIVVTGTKRRARQNHPVQFWNYKDGIRYDCVPLSFTMVRSADNPMLYNYSIKLRGFNLDEIFGQNPENDILADLGLGSLDGSNLFSKLTSVTQNAATLISAL